MESDEKSGQAAGRESDSGRMEVDGESSGDEEEEEGEAEEVEDEDAWKGSLEESTSRNDEVLPLMHRLSVSVQGSAASPRQEEEGEIPSYVLSDYRDRTSRIAQNPLKAALNRRSEEDSPMIPAPAPILSFISSSSQSRFLLLWNIDAFHCWQDIISWIAAIKIFLPESVKIDRVYHTYEKNNHLFWLNFKSVQSTILFRGIVAGRRTVDNGSIGCDFVTGEVFNDFVPISRDSWAPSRGLNADLSLTEPLRSRGLQNLPLNQCIQPAQDAEIFEFSSLLRKKRRKLAKKASPMLPPPSTQIDNAIPSTSFAPSNYSAPSSTTSTDLPKNQKKVHRYKYRGRRRQHTVQPTDGGAF
ncbi:hypothetical protein CVT26_014519 [Gymnopilus dilepis]|uniref:Uncharacterized protein n=1 Tax=Gymnopilus dilepis TaxID=231916 RepID=A0A409W363_9AGAR|nr:hypothetical protein CVT26_014519 [Gymnopilus dilepis]